MAGEKDRLYFAIADAFMMRLNLGKEDKLTGNVNRSYMLMGSSLQVEASITSHRTTDQEVCVQVKYPGDLRVVCTSKYDGHYPMVTLFWVDGSKHNVDELFKQDDFDWSTVAKSVYSRLFMDNSKDEWQKAA